MGRTSSHVTEAEWTVLDRLWEQGPAAVRQLSNVLYPKGSASDYATVHRLLERLEDKKLVRRRRKGGVSLFEAVVDRSQVDGTFTKLVPVHR